MVQINAASVLIPFFSRTIKRLFKSDIDCVIATDAHSLEMRPPLLEPALNAINDKFGEERRSELLKNANYLYEKIILQKED